MNVHGTGGLSVVPRPTPEGAGGFTLVAPRPGPGATAATATDPMRAPLVVAQQSGNPAVLTNHEIGRLAGPDGRIAGSTVDLGGRTAAEHVGALSPEQLTALSPENRAELVRLACQDIQTHRDDLEAGRPANGRAAQQAQMAIEKLYTSYRPSPERLTELRAQTAAYNAEFQEKYDAVTMEGRWTSMAPKEREAVLQDIHDMQARHFGFEPAKVRLVTEMDENTNALWAANTMGDYHPVANEMRINGVPGAPSPPGFMGQVSTVFHEGLHRRQDTEVERAVAEGLPQPATGAAGDTLMHFVNYQRHGFIQSGRMDYRLNPLEQEAWIGTDMMLTGLGRSGQIPAFNPLRPLVGDQG